MEQPKHRRTVLRKEVKYPPLCWILLGCIYFNCNSIIEVYGIQLEQPLLWNKGFQMAQIRCEHTKEYRHSFTHYTTYVLLLGVLYYLFSKLPPTLLNRLKPTQHTKREGYIFFFSLLWKLYNTHHICHLRHLIPDNFISFFNTSYWPIFKSICVIIHF